MVETIELTGFDGESNQTGEVVVKAPVRPGIHVWRAVCPAQTQGSVSHEDASTSFSFTVKPHATQVVVWDAPPTVERGKRFGLKLGVKCPSECRPKGWAVDVRDHEGKRQATATLSDAPWPGTATLYYAEVDLTAPDAEGLLSWEARAPGSDAEVPHAEGTALMWKIVVGVLGPTLLIATVAVAQPVVDSVVFGQGQQLYQDHCALCHRDAGTGNPPTFPALSGNDQLGNPGRIVSTIRQGTGTMPPFPDLTAAEISAVATYIRNAWANGVGGMTTADATALLEGLEADGYLASVWDGVFTEGQAKRGRAAYPGACGLCHGRRLNGAPDDPDMRSTPPLARARVLRNWDGRSLATLFEYTRATMPEDNPGSLTDEEYVDVIAYMLSVGGMPAGEADLRPDLGRLARVVIEQQP